MNKKLIAKYRACERAAHDILNAQSSGLPHNDQVFHLAVALLVNDVKVDGYSGSSVDLAGKDAGQNSRLAEAYGNNSSGGNY